MQNTRARASEVCVVVGAAGDLPMTRLGRSKMSRRMEKQNVAGTGTPDGLSRMQCEYTDCVVFSNACVAKFSQYSTTDWFSNSWVPTQSVREQGFFFLSPSVRGTEEVKMTGDTPPRCTCPFPGALPLSSP